MNRYNDCGGCDDDEIGCQKRRIVFLLWPYRPVHSCPHYPERRCWGPMAEIRLMRALANGLEVFSRKRYPSATPHSPRRREAAFGHSLAGIRPCVAINDHEDRDDAVAQGGIERPCSPGGGGGCGFKSCQRHQHQRWRITEASTALALLAA